MADPRAPLPIKGSTILVTGGRGFVGTSLVRALIARGARAVAVLDREAGGGGRGEGLVADLSDAEATARVLRNRRFDIVFNLAGKVDHGAGDAAYRELMTAHLQCTMNLISGLEPQAVGRFIQLGTSEEYGAAPCPFDPAARELAFSAYGLSKLFASRFALAMHRSAGLPATVVRAFTVYGDGQASARFLAQAIEAAVAGRPFAMTAGDTSRDFVHVEKVVDDLIAAAEDPTLVGRIVNSCTGCEIRLRDLVEYLRELLPAFRPEFSLPARAGNQARSAGVPYRPIGATEAMGALTRYMEGAVARALGRA